jgi:translation initiation factor 2 beta subunit (eIF-2beta)/eIF-5
MAFDKTKYSFDGHFARCKVCRQINKNLRRGIDTELSLKEIIIISGGPLTNTHPFEKK